MVLDEPESSKASKTEVPQALEDDLGLQRGCGSHSAFSEGQCAEADQEGESTIDEPEFYEVSEDEFERLMQAGIFQAPCVHPGALSTADGTFLCDVEDAEFQMLMDTGGLSATVGAVQSRFYDYPSLPNTYGQSQDAYSPAALLAPYSGTEHRDVHSYIPEDAYKSVALHGHINYGYYPAEGYGYGFTLDPETTGTYGRSTEYNYETTAEDMQLGTNGPFLDEVPSHPMTSSTAPLASSSNVVASGLTRSASSSRSASPRGTKTSPPLRDTSRKNDSTSPERQEHQPTKRNLTPPRRNGPQSTSEHRRPRQRSKRAKCENLVFFEFSGTLIGKPSTANKQQCPSSSSSSRCVVASRSEGQEGREGVASKWKDSLDAQPELTREHGKHFSDISADSPNSKLVVESDGTNRASASSQRAKRPSMGYSPAESLERVRRSTAESGVVIAPPARKASKEEDVSKVQSNDSNQRSNRSKRTVVDGQTSEKDTDDGQITPGTNLNTATPSKRCSIKPVLPKLNTRETEGIQKDQRVKRAIGGRAKDNDIPEELTKTIVAAGSALHSARALRTEPRGDCKGSRPRSHGRGRLETGSDCVTPRAPETPRPRTFGPRTPSAPSAPNARPGGCRQALVRQAKVAKDVEGGLVFESSIGLPGILPVDTSGGGGKRDDARVAKRGHSARKLRM